MTKETHSVFITGGAGFIGSRLALDFVRSGAQVTVYDAFHPQVESIARANAANLKAAGVTVIEGDVRNIDTLTAALNSAAASVVYHLAAETGTGQSFDLPARYCDVNVTGTAVLIEAIRAARTPVDRVILAGSRAVYGEGACLTADGTPTAAVARRPADLKAGDFSPKDAFGNTLTPAATCAQTCPVAPASVYASTKLMQEYLLQQGFWGTDTEVGILRLQNVYGPGQALDNPYTGVLSIFARQIDEGRTLSIYEDGEIVRDFVLVDDVVTAFVQMGLVDRLPKRILDIGSGTASTILDVARAMLEIMGQRTDKFKITGAFRPGDIRFALADIRPAKEDLTWSPRHSLKDGLESLIAWSRE